MSSAHVVSAVGGHKQVKILNGRIKDCLGSKDGFNDLAVLVVEGLTEDSLLKLNDCGMTGNQFQIPGCQSFNKQFIIRPLRGTLGEDVDLISKSSADRIVAWDLKIGGDFLLEPGYSGSPVVAIQSGDVLGVVSTSSHYGKKGVAISIAELPKAWDSMPSDLGKKKENDNTTSELQKFDEPEPSRPAIKRAKDFKNEVIEIYRKLKYYLKVDFEIDGKQIDFFAEKRVVG